MINKPNLCYAALRDLGYEAGSFMCSSEGVLQWFKDPSPPITDEAINAHINTQSTAQFSAKEFINEEARRRISLVISDDNSIRERNLRWSATIAYKRAMSETLEQKWLDRETLLNTISDQIEAIVDASNAMLLEVTVGNHEAYRTKITDDVASAPRTVNWP